jgi:drug/metabolite transporter (DMT)-like permease
VPASEIGLTLASVFMIGCGQILFKLAARDATYDGLSWPTVASWLSPAMIAALAISTIATALWVWVLRSASLSVVYPLYALTFVLVPLLEWLLFDTGFTVRHGLGAAAIVLGVWLMAGAS